MTIAAPLHLLTLLVIPLVAAAAMATSRRRRRFAVRFPGTGLFARSAARTGRWRRVLPPALLAAAAAALAVSAAKPERSVAVPVQKASVVLVTDESGSMSATDVAPSRLSAGQSAADRFLDDAPNTLMVGFVGFSSQTNTVIEPTLDRTAVRTAIDGLQADGGTATGDALSAALDRLAARRGTDGQEAPAAVILLSDGQRTEGSDPIAGAERAKQLGIAVSTVAFGTADGAVMAPNGQELSVPPDPATMQQISQITGGTFTQTADAGDLADVYKSLGSKIGTRTVKREVSSSFAAAAVVLLLAGLGTGLRRRPRLA